MRVWRSCLRVADRPNVRREGRPALLALLPAALPCPSEGCFREGQAVRCPCPLYCRYCGRARSRDAMGHYCKERNCQWQHGYSVCTLHEKRAGRKAGKEKA